MPTAFGSRVEEGVRRVGDFELGRRLGHGAFGEVVLATHLHTREFYAIKVINASFVVQNRLEEYVQQEAIIMQNVRHKHVVKLIQVLQSNNNFFFVMEFASGGELFDKIIGSERFDEPTTRKYFQQLVSALNYCHRLGVVHRDLKAENLLLDSNGDLKVCDFGVSKMTVAEWSADGECQDEGKVILQSVAGSPDYISPEMMAMDRNSVGYDGKKADMWSAGVILAFMLSGYLPFSGGGNDRAMASRAARGEFRVHSSVSEEVREVIAGLLEPNPQERTTIADLLRNPWFTTDLDPSLFPNLKRNASMHSPIIATGSFGGMTPPTAQTPPQTPVSYSPGTLANSIECVQETSVSQLERVFHALDIDQCGELTYDELRDCLIELSAGVEVSESQVQSLLNFFADSGNDKISLDQFISGWTKKDFAHNHELAQLFTLSALEKYHHNRSSREVMTELRRAFNSMDTNHNGKIAKEHLRAAIEASGEHTDKEKVDQLFTTICQMNEECDGFTFPQFVDSILQKDILNRQVAGSLLAASTKLNHIASLKMLESRANGSNSGFTVAGTEELLLEKLRGQTAFVYKKGRMSGYYTVTNADSSCHFGLTFRNGVEGYKRVELYRIKGSTVDYHECFKQVFNTLEQERRKVLDDTSPVGEPELM